MLNLELSTRLILNLMYLISYVWTPGGCSLRCKNRNPANFLRAISPAVDGDFYLGIQYFPIRGDEFSSQFIDMSTVLIM